MTKFQDTMQECLDGVIINRTKEIWRKNELMKNVENASILYMGNLSFGAACQPCETGGFCSSREHYLQCHKRTGEFQANIWR